MSLTGFILFSVATNFRLFLLANICYQVGWAFESGAFSALLYDSLKENGKEEEWYRKTEANTFFWCTIGMMIASLLGGFLYRFDIHLPYAASAVAAVGALVFAFYLEEPSIAPKLVQ